MKTGDNVGSDRDRFHVAKDRYRQRCGYSCCELMESFMFLVSIVLYGALIFIPEIQLWEATLPGDGGVFYSSPTLAGDKLYISNDRGAVYVCRVSPEGLEILNHTSFDDNFVATPVLLRDRILLRGTKNLYCIEK
jgi:hypothetical protein